MEKDSKIIAHIHIRYFKAHLAIWLYITVF